MEFSTKGLSVLMLFIAGAMLYATGQNGVNENRRTFDVDEFHSISNSLPADLIIRLGESQNVIAEGEPGQLDQLKVYVKNGELIISRKWSLFNLTSLKGVRFAISLESRDLRGLSLSSSGNAEIQGDLKAEKTVLKTSSRGSITARGDVEYLQISSSSSGDIFFAGVNRELKVRLSSSGEANLDITAMSLEASLSSSGNLNIEGESVETELRLSSGGEFVGPDFVTEKADITISSSANAELTVLKELSASLSSGGDLYYRGNPELRSIRNSGSGEIIKRD